MPLTEAWSGGAAVLGEAAKSASPEQSGEKNYGCVLLSKDREAKSISGLADTLKSINIAVLI